MKGGEDLIAGLIFAGFGAGAVVLSAGYGIGSVSDMGAGFVPAVVGAMLIPLGLLIAGRGLVAPTRQLAVVFSDLRSLFFVISGVVVFGLLINVAGLIVAMLTMTAIAGMADRRGSWLGLAGTGIVMTAAVTLIFVYGLRMNVPLGW